MKALILAAGYATRLYPLTKKYPKPLLPVGEKPIINYIVEKIERIRDIDEIIVITNNKFFPLFKKWAEKLKSSKRISLINDLTLDEHDRRGAIGDMSFAIRKKRISDDLLIVGGDNIFDASLEPFISFAQKKKKHPVIGAYGIKSIAEAKNYGTIKINSKKQVVDFKEKSSKPISRLIAMCIYYFPKETVQLIKAYLKSRSNQRDASGFYIDWLRKKIRVYGFVFSGRWYDIGDYNFYNAAQKAFS